MIPVILAPLYLPVSKLKGIGPKKAEAFARLGILNLKDLIFHIPYNLLIRKYEPDLSEVSTGDLIIKSVRITGFDISSRFSKSPSKIICRTKDDNQITLLFFNSKGNYLEKTYTIGQDLIVAGQVNVNAFKYEIIHPDSLVSANESFKVSEKEPIYSSTYGLVSKYIWLSVKNVLRILPELPEWLPKELIEKYKLPSINNALLAVHNPKNYNDILDSNPNRIRLAIDEVYAHQLSLFNLRKKVKRETKQPLSFSGSLFDSMQKILPFSLTSDQLKVIEEISQDMRSDKKMMRLIQGDVGAGKTLVALSAMLNVAEVGKQSALMVPTELLAHQHFKNIEKICNQLDLKVGLLIGKQTAKQRSEILIGIENGLFDIVVGTHALFQEKVKFKDLRLIIVDEQHRFGVNQRKSLLDKGNNADFLMMTATPIPRTLEMLTYGDLDVSIIHNKPANRKNIITSANPIKSIDIIIKSLEKILEKNEQVYWVCPMIEETEDQDISFVNERYELLNQVYFNQVGLIHGKMKQAQRDEVMKKFANKEFKILVATTVIEVGIDIPDATLIVIENAERFGLSQLHQLRGRVGRSDLQSYCILLYSFKISAVGKERLKVMKESNDGFFISERDLELRGSGDIVGTKQSGLPEFKFFNLEFHNNLVQDIRSCVEKQNGEISTNQLILLNLFNKTELIGA